MKLTNVFNENFAINSVYAVSNKYKKDDKQLKKQSKEEASDDFSKRLKLQKAKKFVEEVKDLAKKYDLNVFVLTDGANGILNNGNECIEFHKNKQIEWDTKDTNANKEDNSLKINQMELNNKKEFKPNVNTVLKKYGLK